MATVNRGNGELISELISRYSPEHGMCWQAEVAMVELGAMDAVRQYISFHTMCWQALENGYSFRRYWALIWRGG